MSQSHVNREQEITDFATNYETPSQVESSVMRYPEVHGGSGYAAATVADLGYEPTMGAKSSDVKPTRTRKIQSRWERGSLRRAFQQRGVQLRGLRLVGFRPGLQRSALAVRRAKGLPAAPC